VVVEEVVVVVDVVPIALISSSVAFPAVPDASPGVLATSKLAFQSLCLPSAVAAASERQLLGLS
jgi:hypothetical protein